MSPGWKIDSSISTNGSMAECIERSLREECTYMYRQLPQFLALAAIR
jgi:hypothetical protein